MANADPDLLIETAFRGGRTRVNYILQSPSGKAGLLVSHAQTLLS